MPPGILLSKPRACFFFNNSFSGACMFESLPCCQLASSTLFHQIFCLGPSSANKYCLSLEISFQVESVYIEEELSITKLVVTITVSYSSIYIPKMYDMNAPLNDLVKKGAKWIWSKECEHAFKKIKSCILVDLSFAHFNPKRKNHCIIKC